jgi:hypothetical protein
VIDESNRNEPSSQTVRLSSANKPARSRPIDPASRRFSISDRRWGLLNPHAKLSDGGTVGPLAMKYELRKVGLA